MAQRKHPCSIPDCKTLVTEPGASCKTHYDQFRHQKSKWAIGRKFRSLTVIGERFIDPVDGIEKIPVRCDCGGEYNYNASTVTQRAKIACDNCVRAKAKTGADVPTLQRLAKLTPLQRQVFDAALRDRAKIWRKTFSDHLGNCPPSTMEADVRDMLTMVEGKSDEWCHKTLPDYLPQQFRAEAFQAFNQYQSPIAGAI